MLLSPPAQCQSEDKLWKERKSKEIYDDEYGDGDHDYYGGGGVDDDDFGGDDDDFGGDDDDAVESFSIGSIWG